MAKQPLTTPSLLGKASPLDQSSLSKGRRLSFGLDGVRPGEILCYGSISACLTSDEVQAFQNAAANAFCVEASYL